MFEMFRKGAIVYIPAEAMHCGEPLVTEVVDVGGDCIWLKDTGWLDMLTIIEQGMRIATEAEIVLYGQELL